MVSGVMVVQKNFRSITSELVLAVDEDIQAIKSSGGSDRVGVHAGEYCGEVGDGRFIYKFILDSELFVPTDTPGRLQVGNSFYEVTIVSIEEQMREVGIAVIPKSKLHEKLVFIDERIAWFGSLNVLSQSRSTESMMRFAQHGFVSRLMECSGASSILRDEERRRDKLLSRLEEALSAQVGTPICPMHGVPMGLKTGKHGPFFGCPKHQEENCKETVNIPREILKSAVQEWSLLCSECGQPLNLVFSRSGHPFLGCSSYPNCKWTTSL